MLTLKADFLRKITWNWLHQPVCLFVASLIWPEMVVAHKDFSVLESGPELKSCRADGDSQLLW